MVVTCQIEFDENLLGTFYAGQLVSGTVILKADKPKDVKAVQLKVCGEATTTWTKRQVFGSTCYIGSEQYLRSVTYLLGSDEEAKHTVQSGVHTYQFACQLPYNCPSSFEGNYGNVRYFVRVVLIRPWKRDQKYTHGFTVLKTCDLNYESPQLRLHSQTSAYRTFCCVPCKTEPLQLKLEMPQTGYVPGETIPLNLLVINDTNIPVAQMKIELIMLVRYFSQYPVKHTCVERIVVSRARSETIPKKCTRAFTRELRVPATPPTCMTLCSVLQIAYHIEVEAIMKHFYGNQMITMPVVIGNVPLWNSTNRAQLQQPAGSRSSYAAIAELNKEYNTDISSISSAMPPILPGSSYDDMPPPTYAEAAHTERGIIAAEDADSEDYGTRDFAPLYPIYDLTKTVSRNDMVVVEEEGHYNESYIE